MEFEAKFPADGFALGLGASDNANFQYCNGIAISNLNVFRTWKATSSTTNEGTQSSISAQHNT